MTAPRNVHGMVPVNGQLLVAIGATGSVRAALVAQPFAVACAGRVTVHVNAGTAAAAVLDIAAVDAHRLATVLLVAARACGEPPAAPLALIRGGPPRENVPDSRCSGSRDAMVSTMNRTDCLRDIAGAAPVDTAKRRAALAARLARRGLELHALASGGWLIVPHATARHAVDLEALEAVAKENIHGC